MGIHYLPYRLQQRRSHQPSSRPRLQTLIETIHTRVRVDLLSRSGLKKDGDGDHVDIPRTALSLFQLETRSEPVAFNDKTRAELRDIHRDWAPGVFDSDGPPHPKVFLLADREVFDAMPQGTFIVKCVEIDHVETRPEPVGRPPRMPPCYYGWMQLTTRRLLELWDLLDVFTLEEIAPPIPASQTVTTWTGGIR